MDPDEALQNLRDLVAQIQHSGGKFATVEERQFAEQFAALDEWLIKGGFPPQDWSDQVPEKSDEAWRRREGYMNRLLTAEAEGTVLPSQPDSHQ